MSEDAFSAAFELLVALDPDLVEIVSLSLQVSFSAVALAALIGMPVGALLVVVSFPGRAGVIAIINTLMGLPPVVVGLLVYLLLSRVGPLGSWGILYTPTAMVMAQCVLVTPLIAALARQTIAADYREYEWQLRSLGISPLRAIPTLLWDGRYHLITALLAGFGRASAEVGAVIIVGGNINHVTRVMTTTIALETSKGNLAMALGLGAVLLILALVVNGVAIWVQSVARRRQGVSAT